MYTPIVAMLYSNARKIYLYLVSLHYTQWNEILYCAKKVPINLYVSLMLIA